MRDNAADRSTLSPMLSESFLVSGDVSQESQLFIRVGRIQEHLVINPNYSINLSGPWHISFCNLLAKTATSNVQRPIQAAYATSSATPRAAFQVRPTIK